MKKAILVISLFLFVCGPQAHALRGARASSFSSGGDWKFALTYDMTSIAAKDLNDERDSFKWSNTTSTDGTIGALTGFTAAFGGKVGEGMLLLEYNTLSQTLGKTQITTYSVTDGFKYDSVYLLYDYPLMTGDWSFDIGLGLGYALKYEFHNETSYGEDVTWKGNPLAYKVRGSLCYGLSESIRALFEVQYEMVSSELEAAKDYPMTTIGGVPIASGQKFMKNGSALKVDMSGIRLGLGLAFVF